MSPERCQACGHASSHAGGCWCGCDVCPPPAPSKTDATELARDEETSAPGDIGTSGVPTLRFDAIPVERSWDLSMLFHDVAGHTEDWTSCESGCDALADEAIRLLFGVDGGGGSCRS